MQWYVALAFVFLLFISIFAYQNPQEVALRFITLEMPSMPLVLLIFFATAMGALITLLFSLPKQIAQGMKTRELQNRVKQLEKQLSAAVNPAGKSAGQALDYTPPAVESRSDQTI